MPVAGGLYQYVTLQNAVSASGNGTALTVTSGEEGGYATCSFQVSGTFSATVDFEATVDGTNWVGLETVSAADSGTVGTSTSSAGIYRATVLGLLQVRARVTWTSGTSVTVTALAVA